MHYRMFSSIPGLYPLDPAAKFPPAMTTKNVLWHYQMSPRRQKITQLKTTALDPATMLSLADGKGRFGNIGEIHYLKMGRSTVMMR